MQLRVTRGTIVLGSGQDQPLLPTFRRGGSYPVPILKMMSKWLKLQGFRFDATILESDFQEFDGDLLAGGRGEVFARV